MNDEHARLRLMLMSNAPWAPTGYGKQIKLFAPRLKARGHEVGIFAYFGLEGSMIHWGDMPVYPRAYHPYGLDVAQAHSQHFNTDLFITLTDAWVLEPRHMPPHWVAWAPVDHEPIPAPVANNLTQAWQVLCYSQSGIAACAAAGIDALYVPHGVDTRIYNTAQSVAQARQALGWPQDAFIAGIVAMNKGQPSRKALEEQIAAFAIFHQQYPDSKLYLHMHLAQGGENQGVHIPDLLSDVGLDINHDCLVADQYQTVLGFDEAYMASVFRAIDVLLSVTRGEGFGVPVLEAQACGTPVIVGNWTALPELCFAGWVCEYGTKQRTNLRAYQFVPDVDEIADKLTLAYQEARRPALAAQAVQGAFAYDADRVTDQYWMPVLTDLANRIADEAIIALPEVEIG